MSLITDYINLVTSQHADKPKFIAMLELLLAPFVATQNLENNYPTLYDVDVAIGNQLDVVGIWVGRSRYVAIPLVGVYFSWDTSGVGWGQGSWKGVFDPSSGLTRLPDGPYRTLLKAKIAANHWDGSIPNAYEVWETAFGNQSQIIIQDNQDMSFTVAIFGLPLDAVTLALLTEGYIPLKPEGVRITGYVTAPDSGPIFAWGIENDLLKGWGQGSWPMTITST